jgi:hypothetical protein
MMSQILIALLMNFREGLRTKRFCLVGVGMNEGKLGKKPTLLKDPRSMFKNV